MGKGYLIDSNTVIDFLDKRLPEKAGIFITTIEPVISIITQIEIFSKSDLVDSDLSKIQLFIDIAKIYPVDTAIALQTIDIRVKYKTKLPDAVIAATAIYHNLILITRNISDFKKIEELEVIDPYNL
jgi:predicted nucleic acid-binding protein